VGLEELLRELCLDPRGLCRGGLLDMLTRCVFSQFGTGLGFWGVGVELIDGRRYVYVVGVVGVV